MKKRGKKLAMSIHHRQPVSQGGNNHPDNLVKVRARHHECWHTLFQSYTPKRIAEIINEIWLDKRFVLVVKRREENVINLEEVRHARS